MDIHLATALIRLAILMIVMHSSFKHRDTLGMMIAVLYSLAICFGTIGQWRWSVPLFSTPLVFLIAWYIIKRQRGQK